MAGFPKGRRIPLLLDFSISGIEVGGKVVIVMSNVSSEFRWAFVILPLARSILKTLCREIASNFFISREGATRNIPLPSFKFLRGNTGILNPWISQIRQKS